MPHTLNQNDVKQARRGREIMRTKPGFDAKPQQKYHQGQERESNPTITPSPRKGQQRHRQNRTKKESPEPGYLRRALLHEAGKGPIVLVILKFYSFVEIFHDRITVLNFRKGILPNEVSSARVEATIDLVAHAKRTTRHAIVVIAGGDG